MLTAYVLSGIKRSKALSSILSAARVLLSTKPTNIPTTARLSTRPCLWALLILPLSNMRNPQKHLARSSAGQQSHRLVQEQATAACTHHAISLGSRSLRSSCTSWRQRSWYSGCFARLYRTQERPLAVVSWPERQADRLGPLGCFSTRRWTASSH